VHFAYVDESGSEGAAGSLSYTLACILVDAASWAGVFDEVISFRRFQHFGIPVRAELKANYLIRNGGALRPLKLSEAARFGVYRQAMRLQPKLGVGVFAVVIRKAELRARDPNSSPREIAWEYLLQRLERFATKGGNQVLLIHDEGDLRLVRGLARKARRAGSAGSAFGTGSLRLPARLLLDDPVPRDSRQSYFLQMADLAAYAAFRKVYPPPALPINIVPSTMWDELGAARFAAANQLKGGIPGLVLWP
jgi:hypothetical protein